MTALSRPLRRFFLLILLMLFGWPAAGRPAIAQQPGGLAPEQAEALVRRALAGELRCAQDANHPMRYKLRKASPRLTTTKEIVETKDGDVARLVAQFDKPLSATDEAAEQARLDGLLSDPSRQQQRKQREEGDMGIVLKLLRMLPNAFLYTYAGEGSGPTGKVERFRFKPNPGFNPPDLESQALTALSGEVWVDPVDERVARLEGHLEQDTDYGWGILGKLDKGGWILLEQARVAPQQWRIARFKMQMNLRVVFKSRSIDTTEELSEYAPVPAGMDYRQAIAMLRGGTK